MSCATQKLHTHAAPAVCFALTMGQHPSIANQNRFAKRLRELRKRAKKSQETLALDADMHRSYVQSAEGGHRNVSLETIRRLAKALGCKMYELMPDWPIE